MYFRSCNMFHPSRRWHTLIRLGDTTESINRHGEWLKSAENRLIEMRNRHVSPRFVHADHLYPLKADLGRGTSSLSRDGKREADFCSHSHAYAQTDRCPSVFRCCTGLITRTGRYIHGSWWPCEHWASPHATVSIRLHQPYAFRVPAWHTARHTPIEPLRSVALLRLQYIHSSPSLHVTPRCMWLTRCSETNQPKSRKSLAGTTRRQLHENLNVSPWQPLRYCGRQTSTSA